MRYLCETCVSAAQNETLEMSMIFALHVQRVVLFANAKVLCCVAWTRYVLCVAF